MAMTTNGEEQGKPLLFQRIKAKNLLSFGPDGIDLELGSLNVLIGPNGSGKSNLLDAISLFQAAPRDLAAPVRKAGGIHHWIWKGDPESAGVVEARVSSPFGAKPLVHEMVFANVDQKFRLLDEQLWHEVDDQIELILQHKDEGRAAIRASGVSGRPYQLFGVSSSNSILARLKAPGIYTEFEYLSEAYSGIRIYRDWGFGSNAVFRQVQGIDIPRSPLSEDFSNLGMFLNKLQQHPKTVATLMEKLQDLYDGLTHFTLNFDSGSVQVYFHEGDFAIPATRLSDGSLRYLCLLAILLDPEPPPFIAIEEPELGIHPDLMPKLVDLLIDASNRTQILVTTHNDTIVDALNDRPETVVVCEKHDGQTEFERLDRADLNHWLERYSLGDLWIKGALGGTRW